MKINKELARYVGLGAEIAASLVVPICLGYWVDSYFDSRPFGILTGSALGLIVFFVLILNVSRNYNEKDPNKSSE